MGETFLPVEIHLRNVKKLWDKRILRKENIYVLTNGFMYAVLISVLLKKWRMVTIYYKIVFTCTVCKNECYNFIYFI